MPHSHPHQHSVTVRASAATLNDAVSSALEGLTDPNGHHSRLTFQSFEVTRINGRFEAGKGVVQVTVEAFGSHKD